MPDSGGVSAAFNKCGLYQGSREETSSRDGPIDYRDQERMERLPAKVRRTMACRISARSIETLIGESSVFRFAHDSFSAATQPV